MFVQSPSITFQIRDEPSSDPVTINVPLWDSWIQVIAPRWPVVLSICYEYELRKLWRYKMGKKTSCVLKLVVNIQDRCNACGHVLLTIPEYYVYAECDFVYCSISLVLHVTLIMFVFGDYDFCTFLSNWYFIFTVAVLSFSNRDVFSLLLVWSVSLVLFYIFFLWFFFCTVRSNWYFDITKAMCVFGEHDFWIILFTWYLCFTGVVLSLMNVMFCTSLSGILCFTWAVYLHLHLNLYYRDTKSNYLKCQCHTKMKCLCQASKVRGHVFVC